MTLSPEVLKQLYQKYQSSFPNDSKLLEPNFNQAIELIEVQLTDDFDWEKLSESHTVDESLILLLKKCFKEKETTNSLECDHLRLKVYCTELAQQFKATKRLRLASPATEQGLQEKFLKSRPLQEHSLIELDIKRHIIQTDMVGEIGVIDCNAERMGLYLVERKRQHEAQMGSNDKNSYIIPMMVKLDPKWSSIIIKVDPNTYGIEPEVRSSQILSESEKKTLSDQLKGALSFNQFDLSGESFSAYPLFQPFKPMFTVLEGGNDETLLHDLYTHKALSDIIKSKDRAQAFKNIESDAELIREAIYLRQIESIDITSEVGAFFQPGIEAINPFVLELIKDIKLTDTKVSFSPGKPERPLSALDYQTYILLLNEKFDASGMDIILNELEMKSYDTAPLQGLSRLKGVASHLPFKQLTLVLPNELEGFDRPLYLFHLKIALLNLSDLNLMAMELKDETGILYESDIDELTRFIEENDIAIDLSLSERFINSSHQRRIDTATSQSMLKRNVTKFLNEAPAIEAISVDKAIRTRSKLPTQNVSIDVELQQEVQLEVAVEASAELSQESEAGQSEIELYTCDTFGSALDNLEFNKQFKGYLMPTGSYTSELWNNWFGYIGLKDRDNGLKCSKPALEELLLHTDKFEYGIGFLKHGDDYINMPAGFSIKKQGRDNYLDFDPKLKLISTPEALAVKNQGSKIDSMLSFSQVEKWGNTHLDHPFKKVWDEQMTNVIYDREAIRTLQLLLPKVALMSKEQAEQLFDLAKTEGKLDKDKLDFLVNDAQKAYQSHQSMITAIDKYIKQLFNHDSDKVTRYLKEWASGKIEENHDLLHAILTPEEKVLFEKLSVQIQPIHSNGLLQLYLHAGKEGLARLRGFILANSKKEKLNTPLDKVLLGLNGDYEQLLTHDFQAALEGVRHIPRNEQTLFFKLLEQHAQVHSEVNFSAIYHTFISFKQELTALSPDEKGFTFPSECHLGDYQADEGLLFSKVMSMPVALARMLALIRHVKEENRQLQLEESYKLDLSSRGMIQVVTDSMREGKIWNFISAKMRLSLIPGFKQNNYQEGIYRAPIAIKKLNFNNRAHFISGDGSSYDRHLNLAADEEEQYVEDFFRFVSFQSKKGSLSFDYYKHVVETVKKSKWSRTNKQVFLTMIAKSSTGIENTQFSCVEKEEIATFDSIFNLLDKPANPFGVGYFPGGNDLIRQDILTQLCETGRPVVAPLPILEKLTRLISKTFTNLKTVYQGAEKMIIASMKLNDVISIYGAENVYRSFLCYKEEAYDNPKLFYDHIRTLIIMSNSQDKRFELTQNDRSLLIQLISAFNLKVEDKDDLNEEEYLELITVFNKHKTLGKVKGNRKDLLTVLTKIDPQKYKALPTLSAQHLIKIMDAVGSLPAPASTSAVIEVIKQFKIGEHLLSEYFDENYLKSYGTHEMPAEVSAQIDREFDEASREVVKGICLNFTDKEDPYEYKKIVDKLVAIKKKLPKFEQTIFIQKLNQTQGLYSHKTPLTDKNNAFLTLLSLIEEQGSPNEFLTFLASDKSLFSSLLISEQTNMVYSGEPLCNQGLDKKYLTFAKYIYPAVKGHQALPFSTFEITPRLHDWILRTPLEQLENSSAVNHPHTSQAQAFLDLSRPFLDTMRKEEGAKKWGYTESSG